MTLPFHPVVVEVCHRMGVSPTALTPHAWITLMFFLALCHTESLEATCNLFLQMYSVDRREFHIQFIARGAEYAIRNPVPNMESGRWEDYVIGVRSRTGPWPVSTIFPTVSVRARPSSLTLGESADMNLLAERIQRVAWEPLIAEHRNALVGTNAGTPTATGKIDLTLCLAIFL